MTLELTADMPKRGAVGGTDFARGELAFPVEPGPCRKHPPRDVPAGIVRVFRIPVETLDGRTAETRDRGGIGHGDRLPRRIAANGLGGERRDGGRLQHQVERLALEVHEIRHGNAGGSGGEGTSQRDERLGGVCAPAGKHHVGRGGGGTAERRERGGDHRDHAPDAPQRKYVQPPDFHSGANLTKSRHQAQGPRNGFGIGPKLARNWSTPKNYFHPRFYWLSPTLAT